MKTIQYKIDTAMAKELKKITEKHILKMCEKFEKDTGLEITSIDMVTLGQGRLISISLNIWPKEK